MGTFTQLNESRRFCVAPMMDCTDRHDRFLLRLITSRALLYTEMVTANAICNGDRERLLGFDPFEHPIALQVGGSDPGMLAECARVAESFGYDEINLNVGCPSDRVRSGRFGACLMAEPALVADCVAAMDAAAGIPVTVKTRIGIGRGESTEQLHTLVHSAAHAGCRVFVVHARRAWLNGLSPKQNREIPPINYGAVYDLKRGRPDLDIVINGGIKTLPEASNHLKHVDGVMLGREAYHNPYMLAQVDRQIFDRPDPPRRRDEVLDEYLRYCDRQIRDGCRPGLLFRHLFGLYQGQPGAKKWRRHLSELSRGPGARPEHLRQASPGPRAGEVPA